MLASFPADSYVKHCSSFTDFLHLLSWNESHVSHVAICLDIIKARKSCSYDSNFLELELESALSFFKPLQILPSFRNKLMAALLILYGYKSPTHIKWLFLEQFFIVSPITQIQGCLWLFARSLSHIENWRFFRLLQVAPRTISFCIDLTENMFFIVYMFCIFLIYLSVDRHLYGCHFLPSGSRSMAVQVSVSKIDTKNFGYMPKSDIDEPHGIVLVLAV